jgi:monoamine oxidase
VIDTEPGARRAGRDDQLSIGIVGAGIAGLYAAWELLGRKNARHRVTVFETLQRPGGRIETVSIDGFKAECGPMRFEPEVQPLFVSLCEALDVTRCAFPPPTPAGVGQNWHLPFQAERQTHGELELLLLGIMKLFNRDPSRPRDMKWLLELDASQLERIRKRKLDGVPLYEMGIWNALSRVLSHQAIMQIRDRGTFYHLIPDNPSAVEWAIFWLRLFQLPQGTALETIPSGVDDLVKKIGGKLAKYKAVGRYGLRFGHTVVGVTLGDDPSTVRVSVSPGNGSAPYDEAFDHLILALPQAPLKKLDEHFPPKVREALDAVIGFPLLKAFLVTTTPWWEAYWKPHGEERNEYEERGLVPFLSQQNALSVPTRELHYFYRERDQHGMALLYTDRPATAFWKIYLRKIGGHHTAADVYKRTRRSVLRPEENEPFLDALIRYLAYENTNLARGAIERVSGAPAARPVEGPAGVRVALAARQRQAPVSPMSTKRTPAWHEVVGMVLRDWSEPPFGAGCHAWKPGYRSKPVRELFSGFSLKDSKRPDNVHICGEAFSDYQGFIEGALTSTRDALAKIPLR